jgi:hypothetical protein
MPPFSQFSGLDLWRVAPAKRTTRRTTASTRFVRSSRNADTASTYIQNRERRESPATALQHAARARRLPWSQEIRRRQATLEVVPRLRSRALPVPAVHFRHCRSRHPRSQRRAENVDRRACVMASCAKRRPTHSRWYSHRERVCDVCRGAARYLSSSKSRPDRGDIRGLHSDPCSISQSHEVMVRGAESPAWFRASCFGLRRPFAAAKPGHRTEPPPCAR